MCSINICVHDFFWIGPLTKIFLKCFYGGKTMVSTSVSKKFMVFSSILWFYDDSSRSDKYLAWISRSRKLWICLILFLFAYESHILWFLSSFYKFLLQHYSFIFHFWINFLVLSKLSKAFIKFVQSLFQFFGAEITNNFFVLFSLKVAHSTPAYVQNFNNDRRVSG